MGMRFKTITEQFFTEAEKSKEEQIREVLEQAHNPLFGLDVSSTHIIHVSENQSACNRRSTWDSDYRYDPRGQ